MSRGDVRSGDVRARKPARIRSAGHRALVKLPACGACFARGAAGYLRITTTTPIGEMPMADKADQALKLAQKVEKDLKALEKRLIDLHNEQDKKFTEAHNKQEKKFTDAHNEQDKRYTELHNQQAKEINDVVAWAKKTFDTKGWF
jgi:hypothetical protein